AEHPERDDRATARTPERPATEESPVNPLDQLEPLIAPAPINWWPPAPGWWLLALLLPVVLWGAFKLLQRLPRKASTQTADAPLDPLRQAALNELERLSKPYDGVDAGPWLQ